MADKNERKQTHAVALFSGGLDSALAIILMLRQNIEVTVFNEVETEGYPLFMPTM